MTIFQAVVLGVVQGITEFLPISSSAHLAIVQNLFGLRGPVLMVFDVVVHLGTLSALFIYFRKDLFPFPKVGMKYSGLIILATIPTVIIGFSIKDWMEQYFDVLWVVALTLVINSVILLSTWWSPRDRDKNECTKLDAFWVGVAQGLSILPGISRSGATVATALWLKVKSEEAVRFSFLIAIPAILGATVLLMPEMIEVISEDMWPVMSVGFISAFISGYAAIYVLFKITLRGQFHYFAYYTFALALLTFAFHFAHLGQ